MQFPLDLAYHMTCHRAQGQTMHGLVGVDLNLSDPDSVVKANASSLMYVAVTRSTCLKNLVVSDILPTTWTKLGNTDLDVARRNVEEDLLKGAKNNAVAKGFYAQLKKELDWKPDSSNNVNKWNDILSMTELPVRQQPQMLTYNNTDFQIQLGKQTFCMFMQPVKIERHIALDQGQKHFGITVVDNNFDGRNFTRR